MEKHKSSAFVINVIANHCNDAPGLLQTWLAAATFDREQMIWINSDKESLAEGSRFVAGFLSYSSFETAAISSSPRWTAEY